MLARDPYRLSGRLVKGFQTPLDTVPQSACRNAPHGRYLLRSASKKGTDADREEIRRTIGLKVLRSDRYPEITFQSTAMREADERLWHADGELTIAGISCPVQIPIAVEPGTNATLMTASVAIAQSSFGIKPFSALMGSLKVADAVEIRAEARIG
jgi:polyisoprenoid-binding protein YceI